MHTSSHEQSERISVASRVVCCSHMLVFGIVWRMGLKHEALVWLFLDQPERCAYCKLFCAHPITHAR